MSAIPVQPPVQQVQAAPYIPFTFSREEREQLYISQHRAVDAVALAAKTLAVGLITSKVSGTLAPASVIIVTKSIDQSAESVKACAPISVDAIEASVNALKSASGLGVIR